MLDANAWNPTERYIINLANMPFEEQQKELAHLSSLGITVEQVLQKMAEVVKGMVDSMERPRATSS